MTFSLSTETDIGAKRLARVNAKLQTQKLMQGHSRKERGFARGFALACCELLGLMSLIALSNK